jgi:uncharacterized beta-barrel protein YwiB (DUF1934 family)
MVIRQKERSASYTELGSHIHITSHLQLRHQDALLMIRQSNTHTRMQFVHLSNQKWSQTSAVGTQSIEERSVHLSFRGLIVHPEDFGRAAKQVL